jgi:ABC-type Fe3+-siderophore transport system permease subunit
MNLDLRIPMGLMFTLVGLILTVFGMVTQGSPIYARSLGINANLIWGIVLLIFGGVMYMLGRRGQRRADREAPKLASPGSSATVRRGH